MSGREEGWLARADRFVGRAADGLALIGAVAVIVMLVQITADVVSNATLSFALPATTEIVSRYWMVFVAFLALPWAERRGQVIRVELLAPLFSGVLARPNRVLVRGLQLAVYLALAWVSLEFALKQFHSGTFVLSLQTRIPVWPSYFALPAAFAIASLVVLVQLLRGPEAEEGKL